MNSDIIDALNVPAYANHEQLEKVNANLERLIGIVTNVQGRLVAIEHNTRKGGGILGR